MVKARVAVLILGTGTNMAATSGLLNDIDVSKLTLTGQGGASYTLTSPSVELDASTSVRASGC